MNRSVVLKVLVGSHAHGLATDESDKDFRSVFVVPTEDMFRLGFKYQPSSWTKEDGDETAWEIGQFLFLATQSHPLILEAFLAPVITADKWGEELRALFPAVWAPQKAYEAFTGYAVNQRTKFLDKKDERPAKYATTYVRVLYNLCELLETGTFTIRIRDTPIGDTIARIKEGEYRIGEVVDLGEELIQKATHQLALCRHKPIWEVADEFILRIRKFFFT